MPRTIHYPLTQPARTAARDLVEGWDEGVLPQTMLFGHYQQGKISIPTFFDLNGNQINYDKAPQRGVMFELSQFNLVMLRTFRDASTLEVILMQELRNAVATDFVVSDYFLTLNSAGVLNMGGTVNIADSGSRLTPTREVRHASADSPADLALVLRDALRPLSVSHDDLDEALLSLENADKDARTELIALLAILGRLLNGGESEGQVLNAVDMITRHMGGTDA